MFKANIPEEHRQKARQFLDALSQAPAPADDTELRTAQTKRVELSGELAAIQGDGSLPLEEAARRVVLIRTQLEILGGRIASLERARAHAEQETTAKAAATRKAAAEFVINAACEVRDQARLALEAVLRPWYRGQNIWGDAIDGIPFIAFVSDRIGGMVTYGLLDQELLRRLENLSAGADFLDLEPETAGPETAAIKQ